MTRKYTVLGSGLLVLGFIVWMMVASVPAAMVIALPMLLHQAEPSKYLYLAAMGLTELLYLVPLMIYMVVTKTNIRSLIGNRTNILQIASAAVFGILLAPALQGVDSVMSWLFGLLGAKMPDTSMMTPDSVGTLLVGIVSIGICAGVAEEPIFRGVVQRGIASAAGKRTAIVLTALLFAFIHMELVGFPTRFIIGLALGCMFWRSGSILPGVFTHAAYNSTVIAMALLFNTLLPNWNGFNIIHGASADVNGVITWVLFSIPFAAAAWGVYRLFLSATPASAAWADKPYAPSSVKFVHTLPWIGVGIAGLGLTAVTLLSMWQEQIMNMLQQYMNNLR